jgi:hypothetical protein
MIFISFVQANTNMLLAGTVIAANLNAPGSWHDSRVAQSIYEKLLAQTPDGFYFVADTAFPRGVQQIARKIRAPIKTGQRMQGTLQDRSKGGDVCLYQGNVHVYDQRGID